MKYLRRIVVGLLFAVATNLVWLAFLPGPRFLWIPLVAVAFAWILLVNLFPRFRRDKFVSAGLRALTNGYEVLLIGGIAFVFDLVGWLWLAFGVGLDGCVPSGCPTPSWAVFIAAVVFALVLLAVSGIGGFIRVASAQSQLRLKTKVILLLFWWLLPVTVLVLGKACTLAAQEYEVAVAKHKRDLVRIPQQVCATRYPLLLVHGIFFRDWEGLNYWGRIPEALGRNGASIHYGRQQSSASVAQTGEELARTIGQIVAETGCEKVNIIAHSKGGLDSRWAISQCGAAAQVASLTTINTPHRGCNFARVLLERIPDAAQNAIGDRYEALFSRLGDPDPDFLAGVVDLTDTECARLNALMPDAPGVWYRSVGSQMAGRFAAPFPLNLGYSIIQPLDGDNDGLVAVSSMPWGEFAPVIKPVGSQGISHADMIDMTRHDIGTFDICEFYVQLVAALKARGL
jgi:triacylglycerol lipase